LALPFEKLSSKPLLSAAFFRCADNTAQFVSLARQYKTSIQQRTLLSERRSSARVFFFELDPLFIAIAAMMFSSAYSTNVF
jgi:hypothetical protein